MPKLTMLVLPVLWSKIDRECYHPSSRVPKRNHQTKRSTWYRLRILGPISSLTWVSNHPCDSKMIRSLLVMLGCMSLQVCHRTHVRLPLCSIGATILTVTLVQTLILIPRQKRSITRNTHMTQEQNLPKELAVVTKWTLWRRMRSGCVRCKNRGLRSWRTWKIPEINCCAARRNSK